MATEKTESKGINLRGFLHPAQPTEEVSVIISDRFKGEDGSPIPFILKPILQEANEQLIKKYTHPIKSRTGEKEKLNKEMYQAALVVNACVQPDFNGADICESYGTRNPLDVPKRMLLAGEFAKLIGKIMDISGFGNEEEIEEEAKNS